MAARSRRIGPIGTATRLIGAAALLYLGLLDGASWGVAWNDAILGLTVFPAVMFAFGAWAKHFASAPVRFTGPSAMALNCAVITVLLVNPYTARAAALFYGATLLVAAWRGQPGCESTVLSNCVFDRDDQIGCPIFSPIDEAEARLNARKVDRHLEGERVSLGEP
jgi:hypothetical protein